MAEAFPIARPVVFPLHGITAEGRCACGWDECSRVGKHAACLWGDVSYGSAVARPAPGAGVGIRTGAHPLGSDVFVVDLDGAAAVAAWHELDAGTDGDETLTVETPRGWHLYFKHRGFPVKTSAGALAPGIDIRGEGGFVVGPGSPHKSGHTYEVSDDTQPADAPAWLLEWLRQQKAPTESQIYPGDVDGPELVYRRRLYAEYLKSDAPARGPALRGQGDQTLFNVVQRGAYDLALPVDDVLELVREHYDPRCDPPWGDELEERVHHKARDAKENSSRPRAEPLPEDLAHLAKPGAALADLDFAADTPDARVVKDDLGIIWGRWAEPIEQPVYLIEGLIPEAKVVTLFAEGGSVKSWTAFSLAICVATGEPWLRAFAVQKGRALILDFEDGRYEFQRRMRLLRGGLDDLPDLGYWYCPPYLDKLQLWKDLAGLKLKVLVIDSLSAGMPGDADENSREFSEAVKMAGRFTELGCTVIIVHHANKTGGMRGHGSVRDQSDVVFKFDPVSETDEIKRMRLICDKPGPQKRPKPVNVELSDRGLCTFEDEANDLGRNATGKSLDVTAAILLVLRDGALVPATIEKKTGLSKDKVASALRELDQLGQIVKLGYHNGWELDDDARRLARILAAAQTCSGTISDLAAAAHVPTPYVRTALERGAIVLRTGRDGDGFIVK